jgi:hypothetical protein
MQHRFQVVIRWKTVSLGCVWCCWHNCLLLHVMAHDPSGDHAVAPAAHSAAHQHALPPAAISHLREALIEERQGAAGAISPPPCSFCCCCCRCRG